MSSRGQSMDINERRLRPIYDCLDSGNNKKAIQEADKVLRKHKDLLCAKALKALALLRLSKNDESEQLLNEVHSNHPDDDSTLQAMTICYKEIPKLNLICDLYEHAYESKPDNEDILSALFMAYVRVGNYKKQQQIAMALHRLKPSKNPYYFWAIMSIIMQAHNADAKLAKSMYLPLAERMASKYLQENKYEAEAEVLLYLMVLEMIGNHKDALEIINGPLGEKIKSDKCMVQEKKVGILHNLEDWCELNEIYQNQLLVDSDDWGSYVGYFTTLFKLMEVDWTPGGSDGVIAHYTLDHGFTFLNDMKFKNSDNLSRGLLISRLYFLKHIKEKNYDMVNDNISYYELICEFYHKFGTKLCCYSDLQGYIDNQYELCDFTSLFIYYNLLEDNYMLVKPVDLNSLQRLKCLVQMQFFNNSHKNFEVVKQLDYVRELLGLYYHSLSFGLDLLANDIQYGDEFLIIASLIKIDIYQMSDDKTHVMDAIYYLEYGLTKSRANFQIKVLLMQMYAHLGAYSQCCTIYNGLEVKHAQNDTLGYLIIYHAFQLGNFVSANSLNTSILKFFHNAHKEISECLVSCYRFGSFPQIYEFILFRDKLNNSLQFLMSRIEQSFYNVIINASKYDDMCTAVRSSAWILDLEDKFWEKLQDDRDFSIFKSWLNKDISIDHLKLKSYDECIAWSYLRYLQLKLILKYFNLSRKEHNHECLPSPDVEDLDILKRRLNEHIAKSSHFAGCNGEPLWCCFKTNISLFISRNIGEIFSKMIVITHQFGRASLESNPNNELVSQITEFCSDIKGLFNSNFNIPCANGDHLKIKSSLLKDMVILCELSCQIVTLMSICHSFLKPFMNIQRKNKKKQGKQVQNEYIVAYQKLSDDIASVFENVLSSFPTGDSVENMILSMNEVKLIDNDGDIFNNNTYSKLDDRLSGSYYKAFFEMKECLTMKYEFLQSMKC